MFYVIVVLHKFRDNSVRNTRKTTREIFENLILGVPNFNIRIRYKYHLERLRVYTRTEEMEFILIYRMIYCEFKSNLTRIELEIKRSGFRLELV